MIRLPDPGATEALARQLAAALSASSAGAVMALEGELGAGKTAFVRALLHALGHEGPVVSPTYTLMEPYEVAGRRFCHLDLYRLADPEELQFLGVRELTDACDWLAVEWPDRGAGCLPAVDVTLHLAHAADARVATLTGHSEHGRRLVAVATECGEDSRGI